MHLWQKRRWGSCRCRSLLPTFVRVIQLEDVRVLGVIGQLYHPAHDGDLFARCGFILERSNREPGGLPGPGQLPPTRPCSSEVPALHWMKSSEVLGGPLHLTYVFPVCAPQGLGSVVQEGGP